MSGRLMHAAATAEMEEPAEQQLRLKEAVQAPSWRLLLHLSLMQPAMTGYDYEGPAWKQFCFLNVHLDGTRIGSCRLPLEDRDVEEWTKSTTLEMEGYWPHMSLDLEAVRRDYYVDEDMETVVFRAGEPHTSGHTAVIGAARVPLLDALALGDDDSDDEGVADKKRRLDREKERNLVEGTRMFRERVPLQGWRPPAPGDVDGKPSNVVCGKVTVLMCLTAHEVVALHEDSD